jgi:hypothetical protein
MCCPREGEVVGETPCEGYGVSDVGAEPATYRLEVDLSLEARIILRTDRRV